MAVGKVGGGGRGRCLGAIGGTGLQPAGNKWGVPPTSSRLIDEMTGPRPLRDDAERNLDALVDAAREVFAERGLSAPLDEIARRAGIGNATLYRRFPTRADLIETVFAESLRDHLAAVEHGMAAADPWSGFTGYLDAVCAMQVRDRGIADLVTMDIPMSPEVEQLRSRAFEGLAALIDRARSAGELRPDCTTEDVRLVLLANAGIVRSVYRVRRRASQRLVHLLLDGLRAEAATDGPVPPSARAMLGAMRQQGRDLGTRPRPGNERIGPA